MSIETGIRAVVRVVFCVSGEFVFDHGAWGRVSTHRKQELLRDVAGTAWRAASSEFGPYVTASYECNGDATNWRKGGKYSRFLHPIESGREFGRVSSAVWASVEWFRDNPDTGDEVAVACDPDSEESQKLYDAIEAVADAYTCGVDETTAILLDVRAAHEARRLIAWLQDILAKKRQLKTGQLHRYIVEAAREFANLK